MMRRVYMTKADLLASERNSAKVRASGLSSELPFAHAYIQSEHVRQCTCGRDIEDPAHQLALFDTVEA